MWKESLAPVLDYPQLRYHVRVVAVSHHFAVPSLLPHQDSFLTLVHGTNAFKWSGYDL